MSETTIDIEAAAKAIAEEVGLPRYPAHIFLREGEVILFYKNWDAGVCMNSGKALVSVMLCWDHRITADQYCHTPQFRLGEDRFEVNRHVDGSVCMGEYGDPTKPFASCFSQSRCPECKQYNRTRTEQLAYGDRITCTTPGCKFDQYYSIGD